MSRASRLFLAPVIALSLASGACGSGEVGSQDPTGTSSSDIQVTCGARIDGPVQGFDISHFQGPFSWAGRGASFGYASIGDGSFIDPMFETNWQNMKNAGVLRGAYQFFEPGQDEVAQANTMVAKVGRLGAGDLPAVIDVEVSGGQSRGTVAAKVRRWLEIVEAGTGRRPMIYTGPYFWEASVADTSFGSYPLWIADYNPSCPKLPAGWSQWVMWQYDGSSVDRDVFNGSIDQLRAFAGPTGTSCNGSPETVGAIDAKYRALGGCGSFLGAPTTPEEPAPDGVGRFSVFQRGSIYWTPGTGAFEVHGAIRDAWGRLAWEQGLLGYPVSDELPAPDRVGRFSVFQRGSIYWTPGTGAHEVHGAIRDTWKSTGWETGLLGYPVSNEYAVFGGRRSDFQHGAIVWDAATNATRILTGHTYSKAQSEIFNGALEAVQP